MRTTKKSIFLRGTKFESEKQKLFNQRSKDFKWLQIATLKIFFSLGSHKEWTFYESKG